MSGKGSNPRPLSISWKEFEERWNNIFDKKEKLIEKLNKNTEQIIEQNTEFERLKTGHA